jgi:hypothetical protein
MKTVAVVLIAAGIGIVIWGGFGFTTREKVIDIGPIHATKDTHHDAPYGLLAGAFMAVAGVVLFFKSER